MINRRSLLLGTGMIASAAGTATTVLFEGREIVLTGSSMIDGDLWVQTRDLPKLNGFEVKPQGACRQDICIPLSKSMKSGRRLNLSAFARKLKQAFVHENELWSFGEIPSLQTGYLQSRIAPGFSILNRKGKSVRLEDFRGRKLLLLTWASW